MIESVWGYLLIVGVLGAALWYIEIRSPLKIFTWLPAIVLIYLIAIALAHSGIFARNEMQNAAYGSVKSWLLPMLLFSIMLPLDFKAFAALGKELLIAYAGAVISLAIAFTVVFWLFHFPQKAAGVFGALAGSWTGGTANMLAVASALEIPSSQLGPALIVDSVLYTLWVSFLLLSVPLAGRFARFTGAKPLDISSHDMHRGSATFASVLLLLLLSLGIAFVLNQFASLLPWLPHSIWIVLLATGLGALGALSPLKSLSGSTRFASFLLYILIALIGSHASLKGFAEIPRYLAAAVFILLLHALMLLLLAKIFRLNLFSVGIASLANIGGVASAPILAAAHHRRLVGAAVIMAVMGYLGGTIIGLIIASVLRIIAT